MEKYYVGKKVGREKGRLRVFFFFIFGNGEVKRISKVVLGFEDRLFLFLLKLKF